MRTAEEIRDRQVAVLAKWARILASGETLSNLVTKKSAARDILVLTHDVQDLLGMLDKALLVKHARIDPPSPEAIDLLAKDLANAFAFGCQPPKKRKIDTISAKVALREGPQFRLAKDPEDYMDRLLKWPRVDE